MTPLRGTLVWPLIAVLGGGAAFLMSNLPNDVNFVILTSIGVAWSVASGFAFQILRKFEDVKSIQGLDALTKEQLKRRLSSRKRGFLLKWAECFCSAILVGLAGGLLKTSATPQWLFLGIGYIFAGITTVLGILIVVEYVALTRFGGDLSEKINRHTRRRDFLGKVRT